MYANKPYFSKYKEDLSTLPLTTLSTNFYDLKQQVRPEDLDSAKFELVELFCEANKLVNKAEWFFQQSLAKIAELPLTRNSSGKISGKILFLEYIRKDPILLAIWLIFKHPQRSAVIRGQTDPKFRNYCSLVPLIMSAFKKYKDINYSEWERSEISGIVDTNLANAMLLTELPEISKEEILETRDFALTPKSGQRAGIPRNPLTTYTLYIPKESALCSLPTLAKIMMCQTWCANPANRTKYMILDPLDWDNLPDPLVSGINMFGNQSEPEAKKQDNWWD